MAKKEELKLIKNGKRLDGRKLDEMRPIEAKVGVLKNADGSAMFKIGNTTAVAGIFGPRQVHPKHAEEVNRAILRIDYKMAPFSTETRSRPGPSRRSKEISMVLREAIEPVVFLEDAPKTAIDVFVEVIQADASTRCAALNAAVLALVDAGIPMRDMVASCSAGKIDGQIALDMAGKEDTEGELDLPVAWWPKKDMITLLQMDGIATKDDVVKLIELAKKGCKQIYEIQKKAIKEKYEVTKHD